MASVRSGSGARILIILTLLVPAALHAQGNGVSAGTELVRLRPGDQIDLAIKNEPALWGQFAVMSDGGVMFPLIGRIVVADRPFEDVEAEVRQAYARELAEPDLLLTPLQRVSVLGEVRTPGMHWLEPTATLRDLMVLGGGLGPSANRKKVMLLRSGVEHPLQVDDMGVPEALPIRSGDQLMVGRRSWFRENLAIFVGAAASVAAAAVTSWIVR